MSQNPSCTFNTRFGKVQATFVSVDVVSFVCLKPFTYREKYEVKTLTSTGKLVSEGEDGQTWACDIPIIKTRIFGHHSKSLMDQLHRILEDAWNRYINSDLGDAIVGKVRRWQKQIRIEQIQYEFNRNQEDILIYMKRNQELMQQLTDLQYDKRRSVPKTHGGEAQGETPALGITQAQETTEVQGTDHKADARASDQGAKENPSED